MDQGNAGDATGVSVLKGVVQNLSQLIAAQRFAGSFTIGTTTGTNTLGTTSTQVVAADSKRTSLVFHNPSSTVMVLLAQNAVATWSAPGGAFVLLPQDYLSLSGVVQSAWNAAAQTGTANPLTVTTFGT